MKASVEQQQVGDDEFLVTVRDLPEFAELKRRVDDTVKKCSWFEKYGWDNLHLAFGCALYTIGFGLVRDGSSLSTACGVACLGLGHSILSAKVIHLAAHGAMGESRLYNRLLCWFTGDFNSSFPAEAGFQIHIREHHPHTNIIGLGDSSTWRVPQLPSLIYLFAAPALLPMMAPLVGASMLVRRPWKLAGFVASAAAGALSFVAVATGFCGLSVKSSLALLLATRSLLSFSYIHINVFQHIGLPMWSQEQRPARLYQMASGALNIRRSPLLDAAFGHSLISCHVEHHLFPRLSDSLCLRVQPLVREFLLSRGLPYNEDSYASRLWLFATEYSRLMVKAPPIWRYVGVQ